LRFNLSLHFAPDFSVGYSKKIAAAAAAFICALAVDRRFSFALSPSPVAVWDVVLFRSVVWWCADYTMSGAFQWH